MSCRKSESPLLFGRLSLRPARPLEAAPDEQRRARRIFAARVRPDRPESAITRWKVSIRGRKWIWISFRKTWISFSPTWNSFSLGLEILQCGPEGRPRLARVRSGFLRIRSRPARPSPGGQARNRIGPRPPCGPPGNGAATLWNRSKRARKWRAPAARPGYLPRSATAWANPFMLTVNFATLPLTARALISAVAALRLVTTGSSSRGGASQWSGWQME